jgi:hypothetical protein
VTFSARGQETDRWHGWSVKRFVVTTNAPVQVTDRWQKFSDLAVGPRQLEALAARCDEFLVHGVDVEGKQLGGALPHLKGFS